MPALTQTYSLQAQRLLGLRPQIYPSIGVQVGLGSRVRASRNRRRRADHRILRRLPDRCRPAWQAAVTMPTMNVCRQVSSRPCWIIDTAMDRCTGCNIRQEHPSDGTVQLWIDCVLRNPHGCGRQDGKVTAVLSLDEVSLHCTGSVHLSTGVHEHVETLEVTKTCPAAGCACVSWQDGHYNTDAC